MEQVEQVYLALRMAVGELLCEEEILVILDDAFAYYDEERMLQTLRWLKEHKKQVIIFTCQTRRTGDEREPDFFITR